MFQLIIIFFMIFKTLNILKATSFLSDAMSIFTVIFQVIEFIICYLKTNSFFVLMINHFAMVNHFFFLLVVPKVVLFLFNQQSPILPFIYHFSTKSLFFRFWFLASILTY